MNTSRRTREVDRTGTVVTKPPKGSQPSNPHQSSFFSCLEKSCDRTFTTSCNLKRHQLSVHGARTYQCDVVACGMRFRTEDQTYRHYLSKHTDHSLKRESFRCIEAGCDRTYMSKGNLTRHLKVNHMEAYLRKVQDKDDDSDFEGLLLTFWNEDKVASFVKTSGVKTQERAQERERGSSPPQLASSHAEDGENLLLLANSKKLRHDSLMLLAQLTAQDHKVSSERQVDRTLKTLRPKRILPALKQVDVRNLTLRFPMAA